MSSRGASGRKRKASNDDLEEEVPSTTPATKKKTKKELKEEAIRRAKKAMEADKKKVEAIKARKAGGASAGQAKEEAEISKETPRKRRKTTASATPPASSASTPAPKPAAATAATTSKKKEREEAIKRAQAWGNKDKQALSKKKIGADTIKEETPIIPAPPAPAAAPQQAINPQIMAQFMMSQRPQAAAASPGMPPYNPMMMGFGGNPYAAAVATGYGAYPGAPGYINPAAWAPGTPSVAPPVPQATNAMAKPAVPPPPSGTKPKAKKSTKVATKATSKKSQKVGGSAKKTTKVAKDDDEEEDIVPPPPMARLEMQISQQVMANASANMNNRPIPFNQPPPEAFVAANADEEEDEGEELEEDDQPIVVDDEPISEYISENYPMDEIPLAPKKRTWTSIVGAIIAAIIGVMAYMAEEEVGLFAFLADDNICFLDSTPRRDKSGNIIDACIFETKYDSATALPCPEHGHCEGGVLLNCFPPNIFQVDADGMGCELSEKTQTGIEKLREILEELSIQSICKGTGSEADDDGDAFTVPAFDYKKLQLAHPEELATSHVDKAVLEAEFFTHQDEDGNVFVGLADDHTFQLPFLCNLQLGLKAGLKGFGQMVLGLALSILSLIWVTLSGYPLVSFIGLIVVVAVRKVQSYQRNRSKLVVDVATARDMAFAKLQDDPETSHAVLHVRDEIVSELTSDQDAIINNGAQRHYWMNTVWPRVVPQLNQDNRIKKTRRVLAATPGKSASGGGNTRDYWQWVASIKKNQVEACIVDDKKNQ